MHIICHIHDLHKPWDDILLSPIPEHLAMQLVQCPLTALRLAHCLNYDLLEMLKRSELKKITTAKYSYT